MIKANLTAAQTVAAQTVGGYWRETRQSHAGTPMKTWTTAPIHGPRSYRNHCTPGKALREAFAARGLNPLTGERQAA